MPNLGQVAYEAYGKSRAWKTFSGEDMLTWDTLGVDIQEGWSAAANAVLELVIGESEIVEVSPEQVTLTFDGTRYAPRVEGVLDNGLPESHCA